MCSAPSDFESQHGLAPLDSGSRRRLSLSQLGSCEYSAEQSPISGSPSRRLSDRPTAEGVADRTEVDKTTVAHRSAAAAASAVLMLCCRIRAGLGAHITVHWKQHHLHAPTDVQVHFVGTSLFFAPSRPRNSLSSREFVSP